MNIYLRRGREQRVLGGHPWVFRSDIEREDGASDGLPVRVLTSAGRRSSAGGSGARWTTAAALRT